MLTLLRRPITAAMAALIFFAAFAAVVTFPFVADPLNTLTAPNWGDVASSVGKYEALKQAKDSPFTTARMDWVAYPVGPSNNIGVDRVSVLSSGFLWFASLILGSITAHSLMTYSGYVLTAFVTFLFVRRVTKSALAALVAGFSYGFWPHMYGLARAAMTYTHMWLFILPIWAFWELAAQGYSKRRVALAGLSVVPAVFWTPYYMFHGMLLGSVGLLVAGYYLWRRHGWRLAAGAGGAIAAFWLVTLGTYAVIGLTSPSTEIPARSIESIYETSAHPLMFILPGYYSWGEDGSYVLNQLVPRTGSVNLYVGLSVIALAAVALLGLQKRRQSAAEMTARSPLRILAVMAALGATTCVLFSLPPTYHFGNITWPNPSLLVTHFVPALRSGQRLVMPLMACLAVLAGIGVWQMLKMIQPKWRLLATAVILAIVWRDLLALPTEAAIHIPQHSSLAALRELPTAPAAQFDDGNMVNQQIPCLYLKQHQKPLINDCGLGRSAALGRIVELPVCEQITALQAVGTRYLIVSPRDKAVLDCVKQQRATERLVAKDAEYQVLILKEADATAKAAWLAGS